MSANLELLFNPSRFNEVDVFLLSGAECDEVPAILGGFLDVALGDPPIRGALG